MAFLVRDDCPGCRRSSMTGDIHHSREEWDRYHNGLRDNDYLTREQMKDDIERGKLIWEKVRKMRTDASDKEIQMAEWEVKKILNRRLKKCC